MALIDQIWIDFADAKYGDEYMVMYACSKKNLKKWFKVSTAVISAGGVVTAIIDLKVPTVIIAVIVCLVQIFNAFETSFISSEKEIDDCDCLRLLYCNIAGDFEKLFCDLFNNKISESEAHVEYFKLKDHWNKIIEPLDTKINVSQKQKRMNKAEHRTNQYLNRYL